MSLMDIFGTLIISGVVIYLCALVYIGILFLKSGNAR